MTRFIQPLATAALAFAISAAASARADIWVSQFSSFDPTGGPLAPYGTFNAALCAAAAENAENLIVDLGTYREQVIINQPITLLPNGGVIIDPTIQQSATLQIASLNTHLYGQAIDEEIIDFLATNNILITDPLHWQDTNRAIRIGQRIAQYAPDIIALQEVWDSTLFTHVRNNSGFAHFHYGGNVDTAGLPNCVLIPIYGCFQPILNSGLATMTQHQVLSSTQVFFNDETGDDDFFEPFASKGYLRTEVQKDGFTIAVYNTHALAGAEDDGVVESTRHAQLFQLRADMLNYRIAHPSVPIILLGDFNIRGAASTSSEYATTLNGLFGDLGFQMIDAAREDHCNRAANTITSDANNRLSQHFDSSGGPSARLDYILYCSSLDLTAQLILEQVETIRYRGATPLTEDGFSTIELSDHWGVHAHFTVVRP